MDNERKKQMQEAQKKNLETQFAISNAMKKIGHKLLVLSGKGGVGKSTTAVNLAYGFAHLGYRVGLLDIDIHGPSIGKMTGIEGSQVFAGPNGKAKPIEKDGIKIISMASLLPPDNTAIIWRGPMKMKVIDQFLVDIDWGELDILVIDSPPGTGDEPLSIIQRIPEMDGAVIITTPQDVSLSDANRTISFSNTLKTPIIGVIENMSGFICPNCGTKTDIFKSGGGKRIAEEFDLELLGTLPIEPEIMSASDDGKPYILQAENSETAASMMKIVTRVADKIKLTEKE